MISTENNIFRVLDTNGNGTGSTSQNVNGSVTPQEFYIKPPSGKTYKLKRVNIVAIDNNFSNASLYGTLTLATGIKIHVENERGEVLKDYTAQIKIKRSNDWVVLAGVDNITVGSAGADALKVRWTFANGCDYIYLNGDKGEKFVMTVNDDMTGLEEQIAMIQGCQIDNKTESNLL